MAQQQPTTSLTATAVDMPVDVSAGKDEPARVLTALAFDAADYATKARSPHTIAAYERDWNHFAAWANNHNLPPLPATPDTITAYIAHLANLGRKPSTVNRRLASISHFHQAAGYTDHDNPTRSPQVRNVTIGIARTAAEQAVERGDRSVTRHAQAIDLSALARIVASIDTTTLKGLRDRALLVIGFAGFFRRSELAALTIQNVDVDDTGITAHLTTTKTDQTGDGTARAMRKGTTDLDPVNALAAWVAAAGIETGPIFRPVTRHNHVSDKAMSTNAIAKTIKTRAQAAGINPDHISGHSLRRGAATTAHRNGTDPLDIARAGGWTDGSRTLHRYIETDITSADAPQLGL